MIKYALIDSLAPDVLLLMGLTAHVAREKLEAWAADESNKHLQLRAKYYLKTV